MAYDIQTPHLPKTVLHSSIRALQCKVHPLTTAYIQNVSPVVLLRVDIDRQQLRRLCLGPQPFCGNLHLATTLFTATLLNLNLIFAFGLCVISGIISDTLIVN
jgi:hypothetical protein